MFNPIEVIVFTPLRFRVDFSTFSEYSLEINNAFLPSSSKAFNTSSTCLVFGASNCRESKILNSLATIFADKADFKARRLAFLGIFFTYFLG